MSANQARRLNLVKAREAKKRNQEVLEKFLTTQRESPNTALQPTSGHDSVRPSTSTLKRTIQDDEDNSPRGNELALVSFQQQQQLTNDLQQHRRAIKKQRMEPSIPRTENREQFSGGSEMVISTVRQTDGNSEEKGFFTQILDIGKSIGVATFLAGLSFGLSELLGTLRTHPKNPPLAGTQKDVGGTIAVERVDGLFHGQSIFY